MFLSPNPRFNLRLLQPGLSLLLLIFQNFAALLFSQRRMRGYTLCPVRTLSILWSTPAYSALINSFVCYGSQTPVKALTKKGLLNWIVESITLIVFANL